MHPSLKSMNSQHCKLHSNVFLLHPNIDKGVYGTYGIVTLRVVYLMELKDVNGNDV